MRGSASWSLVVGCDCCVVADRSQKALSANKDGHAALDSNTVEWLHGLQLELDVVPYPGPASTGSHEDVIFRDLVCRLDLVRLKAIRLIGMRADNLPPPENKRDKPLVGLLECLGDGAEDVRATPRIDD
jgi:hypothetical protein